MYLAESVIQKKPEIPSDSFKLLFNLYIYQAAYNESTGMVDIWREGEKDITFNSITQEKAISHMQQLRSFNIKLDVYKSEVLSPENLLDR